LVTTLVARRKSVTELDPGTGLPVIPNFLLTDERPMWRWYVDERSYFMNFNSETPRYFVSLQYLGERDYSGYEDTIVTKPLTWWQKMWNLPPKTVKGRDFVSKKRMDWITFLSQELDHITPEDILSGAEEVMLKVADMEYRKSLLGAYPPKRLDTVDATE
jgi:hypothetical protein